MFATSLVDESEDFAASLLPSGLVVVHDTERGGEHEVPEATRRQDILYPLLDIRLLHIEARGDHTALVNAANKLDHDLAGAMIVENLEVTDISVLLHHLQELNHHLGCRADENLALSALLGVTNGLKAVSQGGHAGHLE